MKQKPNKSLKCYLDTFGRPSGHVVLKDLMSTFDHAPTTADRDLQMIAVGSRAVIDCIRDRLKGACGGNRKPYVDIITEVEMLNLYEDE